MLENINQQFQSRKVLTKLPYYAPYKLGYSEQFRSDIYPAGLDYYHELNPVLLLNVANLDHLSFFKAATVRDGAASFSSFLMKNFQLIPKLKTHFIIHPDLARLIPTNLRTHFSSWNVYQPKQLDFLKTKKLFITGPVADELLPPLQEIKGILEKCRHLPTDCEIELFIPIRKNPLVMSWKESYLAYELVDLIKESLPDRKLKFVTAKDVLEKTTWKDVYCLDLFQNKIILADNFLNHRIASLGGTVSNFPSVGNHQSVFELALSFYHKLQIIPLPDCDNIFSELIFYKKQSSIKEHMIDPKFYQLLKENNF